MDVRNVVCYRVQQFRRQAGITQEKLAELAGLSVDGDQEDRGPESNAEHRDALQNFKSVADTASGLDGHEGELQTEKDRELQDIRMYLATKKLEEIRLAKRIIRAVMEELDK